MIGDCGLTLQNINGETLPEIGSPMIPEEQYAAIVNGGG